MQNPVILCPNIYLFLMKPVTLFFPHKSNRRSKGNGENKSLKFLKTSICHLLMGSVVSPTRRGRLSQDIFMDPAPCSLPLIQFVLSVVDGINRNTPKSVFDQDGCFVQLHNHCLQSFPFTGIFPCGNFVVVCIPACLHQKCVKILKPPQQMLPGVF